jgi:hypothetical protein
MAQRKKHTKTVILAVIVMLIPAAILGLVLYQNSHEGLSSGNISRLDLTYADGETAVFETKDALAPYDRAIESGEQTIIASVEVKKPLEEYEKIDLLFTTGLNETYAYTLYLSPSATDCLYTGADGAIHLIHQAEAEALLALPGVYARVMPYVSAPEFRLVLSDGTEVLPAGTAGKWIHAKEDGSREEEAIALTADLLPTPVHAGETLSVQTPLDPDYMSVRLMNGENLLYSGPLENLPALNRPAEEKLTVTLECDWYENKTRAYQGTLEFKYLLFYDEEISHSLSKEEAKPGDEITLTVEHTQSAAIAVTCTFAAGEITETVNGYTHVFTIPVAGTAVPGDYAILVMGTDLNLNLPVKIVPAA